MEKFIIHGGKKLFGNISVNGAKNHVLKMIPACFLIDGETVVQNVPQVEDVSRLLDIVEHIGGSVQRSDSEVKITPPKEFSGDLPEDLVPQLRASIVLLGPLLARYGRVNMPHPGGCNLGKRPIDVFLQGCEALGATVESLSDRYIFTAPDGGLVGAEYVFPVISVTGTETLMMAAVFASGTTVLKNAACEPEIAALAETLNAAGARISGAGTHTITIEGVSSLQQLDDPVQIIPDRIETGSFVILAAATRSELTITDCRPEDIEVPLRMLQDIGVPMTIDETSITVHPYTELLPATVVTHEFPGFPTDLQAPMTILLTQAEGESMVRETIYEGRLFYTDTLNTMGANISLLDPYRAMVKGPTPLKGKQVASPDIRAGIALVIAGLMASGTTEIANIYQIDRGYERIEQRLKNIGAAIERVTE